jgi:hypothetical protein
MLLNFRRDADNPGVGARLASGAPSPAPIDEETGVKIPAVRALEVFLAIAYGAVVGSWIPTPTRAPIYALPAAVVTSPLLRAPLPPEPAEREEQRTVTAPWSTDTLPAAPSFAVAPLAVSATGVRSREPLNGTALAAVHPRGATGGCPAIVAEGEPVPPGCQRRSPRRAENACPTLANRSPVGPVLCIRSEN